MFYKIGVLKNFLEFTWKQLRSVTLIKKTPVQVLSCEFCEIFKNHFWQNTSRRLLLNFFHSFNCFLPPSELIETRGHLEISASASRHRHWHWHRHRHSNMNIVFLKDINLKSRFYIFVVKAFNSVQYVFVQGLMTVSNFTEALDIWLFAYPWNV